MPFVCFHDLVSSHFHLPASLATSFYHNDEVEEYGLEPTTNISNPVPFMWPMRPIPATYNPTNGVNHTQSMSSPAVAQAELDRHVHQCQAILEDVKHEIGAAGIELPDDRPDTDTLKL